MLVRGCGTRTPAALYAECRLGPDGVNVEHFLVDPPVPVDRHELGITPRGVRLIERNGVWHIFDWIGSQHYPDVASYIEEVRRFGLSRRLSQNLDFSKLSLQSRIVLLHSRAVIVNHKQYKSSLLCPKGHQKHHENQQMCVKLYWADVEYGVHDPSLFPGDERRVKVTMPGFEYTANTFPDTVVPERQLGIFASFPIHALVVINDPEEHKHQKVFDKAKAARLKVEVVAE